MLHFSVTIPATVPQGLEIPEGLMNNPVLMYVSDFIKIHPVILVMKCVWTLTDRQM